MRSRVAKAVGVQLACAVEGFAQGLSWVSGSVLALRASERAMAAIGAQETSEALAAFSPRMHCCAMDVDEPSTSGSHRPSGRTPLQIR